MQIKRKKICASKREKHFLEVSQSDNHQLEKEKGIKKTTSPDPNLSLFMEKRGVDVEKHKS